MSTDTIFDYLKHIMTHHVFFRFKLLKFEKINELLSTE